MRVTLLTTLQCNFACDYCIQGDHHAHTSPEAKMSLESAARVADWMEQRLDALGSPRFTLTFFGGEPLLNLPVVYALAERMWKACRERGVVMTISVFHQRPVAHRGRRRSLAPLPPDRRQITLDGDRATHDRLRPLPWRPGHLRPHPDQHARHRAESTPEHRGNFDVESAASYPELLAFLRSQPFADRIAKIAFKPIIRGPNTGRPLAVPVRTTADGRR